MVNPQKKYKTQVITPEQDQRYPTLELGQEQNIRILRSHIDNTISQISVMLGQFLRTIGCTHVESLDVEFRELSATEREQWVWHAGLAPLNGRDSKMFRFGMPRAAATAMTEATLGLKPSVFPHMTDDQPPSETELRFLKQFGQALIEAVIARTTAFHELNWQLQSSDIPQKKGYCLKMRLIFPDQSWPLTLYWHPTFAKLHEQCSDQIAVTSPVTRPQLEASLSQIPVQLKTTLFSAKLTIAELEQLLQGDCLPVVLPEQLTLGCGNFVMGVGRLYDRNGHLAFHLVEAS